MMNRYNQPAEPVYVCGDFGLSRAAARASQSTPVPLKWPIR